MNTTMSATSNTIIGFSMFFSLLFLLLGLLFLHLAARKKKIGVPPLPPGPSPLPYVGSLFSMLLNKPVYRWIHRLMDEMDTEILCVRLGRVHIIAVSSPELASEFLKHHDAVFSSRSMCMSSEVTSNGYLATILSPLGDQWKKMRKILNSKLLSVTSHRWLAGKRNEEADHLLCLVYNLCRGDCLVNVRYVTQHYCANVIRKLVFGKRWFGEGAADGGAGVEEVEHVDGLFTILYYLNEFCVSDYLPWLRGYDLDGQEKIMKTALESVRKYQDHLIEERIREWKNGERKIVEDWLDVLIEVKDENDNRMLSIEEIKGQVVELMIAAVDNPSNAVEWALAEMINQPAIMQKAIEELDTIVGRERLVQESDLPQLNYIKSCAKEAFRLHPIAPFNVPHVSVSNAVVGGYFIPNGSHVLLSRLGLGRNPRIWEEPLRFKPERHLNKDGSEVVLTKSNLTLLSFSIGRRGCPGVLLGSTMIGMLMARLLQGFTWSPPPCKSTIDLTESVGDLFLAHPLMAIAKPRLADHLYHVAGTYP